MEEKGLSASAFRIAASTGTVRATLASSGVFLLWAGNFTAKVTTFLWDMRQPQHRPSIQDLDILPSLMILSWKGTAQSITNLWKK
jgi:hypothetical protein